MKNACSSKSNEAEQTFQEQILWTLMSPATLETAIHDYIYTCNVSNPPKFEFLHGITDDVYFTQI